MKRERIGAKLIKIILKIKVKIVIIIFRLFFYMYNAKYFVRSLVYETN